MPLQNLTEPTRVLDTRDLGSCADRARTETFMKTLVHLGFIVAAISFATLVESQSQSQQPTFEVAAIRSASLPTPQTIQSGQFRTGSKISGSNLDFEFVTLADLVPYAYRVKSFQVAAPDWTRQSRWNIVAKLPEGSSRDQAPEMMQALLIERFKLSLHRENRQQPVYELVVAKEATTLQRVDSVSEPDSDIVDVGLASFGFFPPGPPRAAHQAVHPTARPEAVAAPLSPRRAHDPGRQLRDAYRV